MIAYLSGKLERLEATSAVVEVGGIGFFVHLSVRASASLPPPGSRVKLPTYLHVREEALELYGFSGAFEREVFLRLLTVAGIGPKLALRILSEEDARDLVGHVLAGDVRRLTALRGVGKKTAEVLVASLKAPLSKLTPVEGAASGATAAPSGMAADAVRALASLGVREAAAHSAVNQVLSDLSSGVSLEAIVAEALRRV